MVWRKYQRIAIQIGAAASSAILPFAVLLIFGQNGFKDFTNAYSIYVLSLFLGTLGLDLALARIDFLVIRACTILFISVAVVSLMLTLSTPNEISIPFKICIMMTASSGAVASYLANKIYFLKNEFAIRAIAQTKLFTSIVGAITLNVLLNPIDGIILILIQNVTLIGASLFYGKNSFGACRGSKSLSSLPRYSKAALASFFTFSFPGLLQAYERYLAAGINHPTTAIYIILSTCLSALTYIGTGIERTEYSKSQTAARITKSFTLLALLSAVICVTILFFIFTRLHTHIVPLHTTILIYCALSATIHIACYFSAAPVIFSSFSDDDIGKLATQNILISAPPLLVITIIFITGAVNEYYKIIALGLSIPTAVWMSSVARMRVAITHAKKSK